MNSNLKLSLTLTIALGLSASFAFAEPTEPKKIVPKTGLLSSTSAGANRYTEVDTGQETVEGGKYHAAPIAGSVSRISPREWKMVVGNNTKDPYSVDVTVKQINQRLSVIKTDHFSYTLRAGEQQNRTISALSNAVDAQLVLDRWTNLAPPEKKKEVEVAPQGAPATSTK